jgi:hypothetical protein
MTTPGSDDIPIDVKKLLGQSVRSVGHLETLLFVFGNRTQDWSAVELSRELRTNEAYASHQLEELYPILERVGDRFRYAASSDLDITLQKLADLYRERRHAIINFIYAKPPDALRSFADAFKLKKD